MQFGLGCATDAHPTFRPCGCDVVDVLSSANDPCGKARTPNASDNSAGELFSGPTVHFVDDKYDNGEILLQRKVPVSKEDTPESLQKKVLKEEHTIYTEAIKLLEERE